LPAETDYEKAAAAAVKANKLAEVRRLCTKWAEAKPQDARPRLILGRVYLKADLFDRALEQFMFAAEANPLDPEPCCAMGAVFLAAGRTDDATREFQKALDLDKGYTATQVGLGRVDLRKGAVELAVERATNVLSAEPKTTAALVLLGDCHLALDQIPEAVEAFGRATQAGPHDPDAHAGYAAALERGAETEAAQEGWDRYLEVESDTRRAHLVKMGCWPLVTRTVTSGQDLRALEQPSWSPDGRYIVLGAHPAGVGRCTQCWVVDPSSAQSPRVVASFPDAHATSPSWSPDGRTIAFHRQTRDRSIWTVGSDGAADPTLISNATRWESSPVFLPTGRILYQSTPAPVTCRADGSDRRVVVPVSLGSPRLSHDGSILFGIDSRRVEGKNVWDIIAVPVAAPDARRRFATEGRRNGRAEPSPLGGVVAFLSDTRQRNRWDVRVIGYPEGRDLFLVERAPGGQMWKSLAWAPDGRSIAFVDAGRVRVTTVGGKRQCPIAISAVRRDPVLAVSLRNYGQPSLTLNLDYEFFDGNSCRIAQGAVGQKGMTLAPGDVVECEVDLTAVREPGLRVAKLTAVTTGGARIIELVELKAVD